MCAIKRRMNVKIKKKQSFYGKASECYFTTQNFHDIQRPSLPNNDCLINRSKLFQEGSLHFISLQHKLDLGDLKPTAITPSLADRSMKVPKGIIEDVLIQVCLSYRFHYLRNEGRGRESHSYHPRKTIFLSLQML